MLVTSSVGSIPYLRKGGRWFDPRLSQYSFREFVIVTTVHCFDNGYMGKQLVVWKRILCAYILFRTDFLECRQTFILILLFYYKMKYKFQILAVKILFYLPFLFIKSFARCSDFFHFSTVSVLVYKFKKTVPSPIAQSVAYKTSEQETAGSIPGSANILSND